jgi:hypothetical protein
MKDLRGFIKTTIREFVEEQKQKELKETFDSNSTFKRNVYGDDEKYREITKDKTIIWNPDYKVAFQYIFDNSEVKGYTFVHLYPYNEGGYNYEWEDLSSQDKSKIFIDAIRKLPKVVKEYMKKFGKLDKIVFRPKTSQMGNIYSSPSIINRLKSIYSDYDVEINKEDSFNFPKNTIIMKLKKPV